MITYVSMQSLQNRTRPHFLLHCKPCLCESMISLTTILGWSDDIIAQQVAETYFILKKRKKGKTCISEPFVVLKKKRFCLFGKSVVIVPFAHVLHT
uniref:Tick transposon n=1 Tax=Rhipicephalus appendiculatus TaxID=34631 RepID=A0A131Y9P8_RHIAP